jgi:hypothetical protein
MVFFVIAFLGFVPQVRKCVSDRAKKGSNRYKTHRGLIFTDKTGFQSEKMPKIRIFCPKLNLKI